MESLRQASPYKEKVHKKDPLVFGVKHQPDGGGAGVVGINNAAWLGVHGIVRGEGGHGVLGETTHDRGGAGVIGISKNWIGVYGELRQASPRQRKVWVHKKDPLVFGVKTS